MQSQAQLRGQYSGTSSWQNTFTRSNNELPSVSQLLFLINPIQRWTWHTFPSHIYLPFFFLSFFFFLLLTFCCIPEFMTSFEILPLPNALYPRVLWTWILGSMSKIVSLCPFATERDLHALSQKVKHVKI